MEQIDALYNRILVDTLSSFVRFCRAEDLRYYLAFGSAIGCIRHQGMIPWDDDIDVYMPREDYERMLEISRGTGHEVEIVSPRNSTRDIPFSYAKWCNPNTTLWERWQYPLVIGVFIDIFPLDRVGSVDEAISLKKTYVDTFVRYRRGFRRHSFGEWLSNLRQGRYHDALAAIQDILYYRLVKERSRRRFISMDEGMKDRNGDYLLSIDTPYSALRTTFHKDLFSKGVDLPFDSVQVTLPFGWDEILTQIYGDYMTPPPVSSRQSVHYHYFMDLERRLSLEEVKAILDERARTKEQK